MRQALRAGCDRLAAGVRMLVFALAALMLAVLSLQVVMRYVFGHALSWSEELALGCFSWSMLLAIALGVREGIHVRMELLVDRLPQRLRSALERLALGVTAAVGVFVAWSGGNYVVDSLGATSAAIGYPTAYLYACAPASGALIALFALEAALLGRPGAGPAAPTATAAPASPAAPA